MAALAGLAAGLAIGVIYAPSAKRARDLDSELSQLRAEHERYRKDVTHHFSKTGELVNAMTRTYKAVYDHLASGAQTLSEAEIVTTRLQFYTDKVPVLNAEAGEDIPEVGEESKVEQVEPDELPPLPTIDSAGEASPSDEELSQQVPRDYAPEADHDTALSSDQSRTVN